MARVELRICPGCGTFSAARRMTKGEPPLYCVICEHCGCATELMRSLSAAVRAWNRGCILAPSMKKEKSSRPVAGADCSEEI